MKEKLKEIEKEMMTAEKVENEVYNKSKLKASKEDLISFSSKINKNIKDNSFKTKINTKIAYLFNENGFLIEDNVLVLADNSFTFNVYNQTKDQNKIVKYIFSYGNTNICETHILYPDGSYVTEYERTSINENNIKTIYEESNIFEENGYQISKEVLEVSQEIKKEMKTETIIKKLFIRKDNQIYKMENKEFFKDNIKEELQRCDYEEYERYYVSDITNKKEITTRESYKEISLKEYKEILNSDKIGKVKLRQKY